MKKRIVINDSMQKNYSYELLEPEGKNFSKNFLPFFSPSQMLELGVFEGKYINDCQNEFPAHWFSKAKLSQKADIKMNYFKIKSRKNLIYWRKKEWIIGDDVRGWFQWYCRYYYGRRNEIIDKKQIARWVAFKRHSAQVEKNCTKGNLSCRPRQRQALLQWSYNPFI